MCDFLLIFYVYCMQKA